VFLLFFSFFSLLIHFTFVLLYLTIFPYWFQLFEESTASVDLENRHFKSAAEAADAAAAAAGFASAAAAAAVGKHRQATFSSSSSSSSKKRGSSKSSHTASAPNSATYPMPGDANNEPRPQRSPTPAVQDTGM
jgi:hypothetical protein